MNLSFAQRLLAWYDSNQRHLPWRHPIHPYTVWLSEIMLQQTTVPTAIPYFLRFIERFPTVEALAQASLDEVLLLWQGLGYYGRAHRLLACAKLLAAHGFPETVPEWQALPGVGPYTAAAICAIAYQHNVMPIDANIHRIFARQTMLPVHEHQEEIQERFWTDQRHGDFVQALMDLGSLVCRPRAPLCSTCPVQGSCLSFHRNATQHYPPPKMKPEKPTRHQHALILERNDGALWMCQENTKALLKGLYGVPLVDTPPDQEAFVQIGTLSHVFTHFHLLVTVWHSVHTPHHIQGGWHIQPDALPLSTLMKKILALYKKSTSLDLKTTA